MEISENLSESESVSVSSNEDKKSYGLGRNEYSSFARSKFATNKLIKDMQESKASSGKNKTIELRVLDSAGNSDQSLEEVANETGEQRQLQPGRMTLSRRMAEEQLKDKNYNSRITEL